MYSTNSFTGFDLEVLQGNFDADFRLLSNSNEDDIEFIEQCHVGDMLIEEVEEVEGERFRLWRILDENGGGILIEYCGAANSYVWETVYES